MSGRLFLTHAVHLQPREYLVVERLITDLQTHTFVSEYSWYGWKIELKTKHSWKTAFRLKTGGYKPERDVDPTHHRSRAEQTAIFGLRTGHCGLKAQLKRVGRRGRDCSV